MEIKKFGSLIIRSKPVLPGRMYYRYKDHPTITLGASTPGNEIEWLEHDGLLIATRNILKGVSWEDLDRNELILGKKVEIDGKRYLARTMKNGANHTPNDEWGHFLDSCPDESLLWNISCGYSWCMNAVDPLQPDMYDLRGGSSARGRAQYSKNSGLTSFGWRPVLEPIRPIPPDIDMLIGVDVVVKSQDSTIHGKLESVGDYDLMLRDARIKSFGCNFREFALNLPDGSVIADLSRIDFVLPLEETAKED